MGSIAGLFYRSAEKYPHKRAIWCDGEEMAYAELEGLVSRLANYLISRGVGRGDIIGIPMNNSIVSVALIFAAAAVGAGLAPVNPTIPGDAVEAAFRAANVRHLIARRYFYLRFGGRQLCENGTRLCLDGEVEGADNFDAVLSQSCTAPDMSNITGDETLILTMTSGSTGDPKPIGLTQNNKLERAFAHIDLYGITTEDRILAATPLYHSLAERLVIMPLIIGAESVLLPRFTPDLWLNCVKEQKVTFTIAVSAQLGQIAQLLSSPFAPEISSLRTVVSSSALLEPHVRNELINKLQCDFHEMYGTSECSTVTNINLRDAADKTRSVGKPLPGVEIRILDGEGNGVPPGEVGEIAVRTPLMCRSYYRMPEKTEEAMAGDFFKTGDLGYVDGDGYLYFAGRRKELIITGGVNVYPQDVERVVGSMQGVAECAAFSYADERLGEVVALAVVPEKGAAVTRRDIRIRCARMLADFQQPQKIFFLAALPRNAMGKIMKNRLPETVAGMES
jgi:long-chain acyl-CoA synthetase